MADLMTEIRNFEGSEEELIEFLVNYDYTPNDVDHDDPLSVQYGPHPDSVAALPTVPRDLLPRRVLYEVIERRKNG